MVHEDTAYLRKQAATNHAGVLEAMRGGERGLQLIVEQQRENRTLLMHVIMELESKFQQHTILSQQVACSVPVTKLTHTTPSKDEKPSRPSSPHYSNGYYTVQNTRLS